MASVKMPSPGRFPTIGTSLRSQTLVVLLSSDDMAGVESLFEHRKIALNTVIRALIRKYGWPIERHDFPTNTADGRGAWASVYSLPVEVVEAALAGGGSDWVAAVRAVRAGKAARRR
ncbi:hypothetical protein [Massilia sp. DWR3-1-1]|uniref:hypothetical protein n=1 Tax=Massilia sp. DWR3-1-1 TaxID=2804559 RepID=UPI003CF27A1D